MAGSSQGSKRTADPCLISKFRFGCVYELGAGFNILRASFSAVDPLTHLLGMSLTYLLPSSYRSASETQEIDMSDIITLKAPAERFH